MRVRFRARPVALLVVAIGVFFAFQWSLAAQAPAQGTKRPISYDVMDYWRSIGGTRLSNDGQWLAYSVTSQAEDGELVVRNVRTGQEFHHPRGTGALFTEDGKFCVFTIAQPKADAEREQQQAQAAGAPGGGAPAAGAAAPASGQSGGRGNAAARNQPRTGLGIMTLADGKVQTIERVGSFRLPAESAAWLAYYKGTGGGGAGGGGARGAGRGAGAPAPAAAAGRQAGAGAGRGAAAGQANGEKRKDPGADLILRNLATGEETTIPEVTEYDFDTKGIWLAYATSSTDAAKDGVFIRRLADASVKTAMSGRGHYKSMAFDQAGQQLAFLSDQPEYEKPVSPYRLYLWKAVEAPVSAPAVPGAKPAKPAAAAARPAPAATAATAKPAGTAAVPPDAPAVELVSATTPGMPKGMVVADNAAPRFSRDGSMIYLATGPPPAPPADPNQKAVTPTGVDLWSYKDAIIQPMQKVRVEQDRTRTYRAVLHLADKHFVQLATSDLPTVNPGEDPLRTLGMSDLLYQQESSWDQTYNDVFLVDLKTGARKKILEHWGAAATLSPGGNYVLYFDENKGNWFTYKIADGTRTNLTGSLPVKFYDESHDTPDQPPALGVAGWTEGDKSVLLNDEFDVWEIRPDGTGARVVTNGQGRKQGLIFRYRAPFDAASGAGAGPAAGPGAGGGGRGGGAGATVISTTKAMTLQTTNKETRASGFYKTAFTGTAAPEKIVMMDKNIGAPQNARNADVLVFTEQTFSEFPDLWVSDSKFTNPQKVSNANPQQAEYIWGKAELIKYINGDGRVLNARLIRPDNFDPSKKYPLMVYIYEELSNGLHSYQAPNVGTSINLTRYVSNGYVVLEPDIVYETGYPGPSAMKCVIPAINTVVAQGYIDPKRIGIQGHSWGGYQITYMITQTDIFRAVEAGASVSNMISAYDGIRWGTGMVRQFQYEKTQSRIGAAPWDAPLEYIENSPIFWVKKVHTPYLTIHNDADDAVPWYQGIEFNMALRRLGKEAYMFSFNGEPHGLRNRDNMKHWTVHMDEFFDHYLLGKPRPAWMDNGISFLDHGKRDVLPMFKKKTTTPTTTDDK